MPPVVDLTPWFGDLVARRREFLGMHPNQIAHAGGPSTATTRKIEAGCGTTTATVLIRLDGALRWDAGASTRALLGGESGTAAEALRQSVPPRDRPDTEVGPLRPKTQERAERTRRRILDAVAATIARQGSTGSIRDVMAAANISKGAVYFHFGSKDAVVVAMLGEAAAVSVRDRCCTRDRTHTDGDGDGGVRAVVGKYVHHASRTPLLRAEAVLWNEPAYASTARAGSYRTLRDTLIGILEETSEPADAVASADAVMAILGGVLTIPGDRHGLADPEVCATVHRLIAPVLR